MKLKYIKLVLFPIITLAALSAIVMLLWNLLIPGILGLATINFWQALGLFILARILFGGLGFGRFGRRGMMHSRENPIHEKWRKMSPEQRLRFIEKRRRFGFGGPFGRDHSDMEEHGKGDE
ncbi:MAG: hypothetical protein LBV43_06525 [Prevotella sp.]|jgi:hypothetical protein|nr:hypothetical protein [Prevotella sp.]